MRTSFVTRQSFFALSAGLLLLLLLAACGSTPTGATANTSKTATTPPAANATVAASGTAAEQSLLPMMTLVGQPTAKLVTGHHIFEVVGKIKNGDTKQHDIYVQATLLDATGAIIGSTAFFNVDNVPGGGTGSFTIQGTTMQPTWVSIQVKVVGVSENVGSAGGD